MLGSQVLQYTLITFIINDSPVSISVKTRKKSIWHYCILNFQFVKLCSFMRWNFSQKNLVWFSVASAEALERFGNKVHVILLNACMLPCRLRLNGKKLRVSLKRLDWSIRSQNEFYITDKIFLFFFLFFKPSHVCLKSTKRIVCLN